MADTYKDRLKYKSKHVYKLCKHSWHFCNKDCPAFNFPWYKVPLGDSRKKTWRDILQKQYRSQVSERMRVGDYDNLPIRPLRYAWFVW